MSKRKAVRKKRPTRYGIFVMNGIPKFRSLTYPQTFKSKRAAKAVLDLRQQQGKGYAVLSLASEQAKSAGVRA